MPTFNFTNSTNDINQVEWSYSTKLEFRTDRKTTNGVHAKYDAVESVENLGVGVTKGNPFTLLG
jgi:hypothetical protein